MRLRKCTVMVICELIYVITFIIINVLNVKVIELMKNLEKEIIIFESNS